MTIINDYGLQDPSLLLKISMCARNYFFLISTVWAHPHKDVLSWNSLARLQLSLLWRLTCVCTRKFQFHSLLVSWRNNDFVHTYNYFVLNVYKARTRINIITYETYKKPMCYGSHTRGLCSPSADTLPEVTLSWLYRNYWALEYYWPTHWTSLCVTHFRYRH
jgi:hypothetical protein